jgi:hypothetical protein
LSDSSEGTMTRQSGAIPDLIAQISEGEFDDDLSLLMKVIRTRWEAVGASKTLRALANLQLGTKVRIKDEVKTKRLRGLVGKVV